jgi:hypothetical protein
MGAPGASLLGTWVSPAATHSSETEDFFLEFPRKLAMSSPSTLQNLLNQQKTKEKKLSRNWHSSYAPSCKIEAVEKTRETPAARRGFSCL